MIDLIDKLNQTSQNRVLFYSLIFIFSLAIVCNSIVSITTLLINRNKSKNEKTNN